ncbi:DUF3992 domain-containing protein [Alkalihalobacillus sp. BA299]|uniref:DUF3992 domain-containing protein n=1 Tax=Alkalihalobacillus sp. BA299 TaxID=2815938 RepID=UPI001ADD2824|nr:S-Ena type endospore appendage [Alkalihalobacillus sp. BA299]
MDKEECFTDYKAHCIQVEKVYDWVTLSSEIKLKEKICIDQQKPFTDCVTCPFKIPCSKTTPTMIWGKAGVDNISGSLTINYTSGCNNPLIIIINGDIVATLSEGQSFCTTIVNIQSVELLCHGNPTDTGFCIGEFKLLLHYQSVLADELDLKNINCFLSDSKGNPLRPLDPGAVICEEFSNDRENFQVPLSNREITTLNKVVLLKKGFITIQFFNKKGDLCNTCTVPFNEVEKVSLCAPPGTKVECEIISFGCEAFIIPSSDGCHPFVEIVIIISICQSVTTTAETIVGILGRICEKVPKGGSN